jgi:phosphatidate cytidylyltransferase
MARMEEAVTIPSTLTPKPKKGKKAKSQTRAENETASLPSTTFSPELPESLPVPSSPSARPQTPDNERFNSNHKRPAPSEFNLDTKGVLTPPAKGVKFEDGLSPGQGKEGETVIPGIGRYTAEELKMVEQKVAERAKAVVQAVEAKKNSNVFERTIWTLIMIGGFISTFRDVSLAIWHIKPVLHHYSSTLARSTLHDLACLRLSMFGLQGDHCTIRPVIQYVSRLISSYDRRLISWLCTENDPSEKTTTEAGDQWSKTLNWYFFVVANYFLYGESIIYYFKVSSYGQR